MKQRILLDTGPLVALLNSQDNYHAWAKEWWAQIEPPLLTCEPVIVETCFLLKAFPGGHAAILQLIRQQVIQIIFHIEQELDPIDRLLAKYRSVPMSLADACLVRMAETTSESTLFTLDSDFRVYRKHQIQLIPLIAPFY